MADSKAGLNSKDHKMNWVVHKFGGTSVANAERYRGVASLLGSLDILQGVRRGVVVSAMSKVTDALIDIVESARRRDEGYRGKMVELKARHLQATANLLPADKQGAMIKVFEADFAEIEEVLRGVWLTRTSPERTAELISGYGEIWSAQLLNAFLNSEGVESAWLDARSVLVVEPGESSVTVDWLSSRRKIGEWLAKTTASTVIITGFVASTPDGIPTTLKRNGSDYSASLFGALLKAREIVIWTDVDGVLSADPRLVPEAEVLLDVSYEEATEMAYFGAKVVHPNTMAPAIQDKIPIWIRNTFNPAHPGTKIHLAKTGSSSRPVKGFAAIEGVALVNVEGTGMIGVPGVAQRLFGALREVGVSVVMISQASSEHSICFAVFDKHAALAKETVEKAFFAEMHHGQISRVDVKPECSILAAVGDSMVEHPGVSGRFFSALGRAGINIRAIAQGSSERNISAVIDRADAKKALRAVHSAFYLSDQTLSIGVIGPGLIGGTFLDQLASQAEVLKKQFRIDLRVRGLIDSKRMWLDEAGIDLANWREKWKATKDAPDLMRFAKHVRTDFLPHAVLVDCTANAEIPKNYPQWIIQGLHLITPNKKGNTGTMESYRTLREKLKKAERQFLYETTVGAGLPIINTLRDLVQTGDRILQIDGVVSGTLSYLFNTYDGKTPFSSLVKDARERGYTEPDPRDDLSGMDVARKLVILAREMGLDVELEDVPVESLVPAALRSGSVDEYLSRLPQYDEEMKVRWQKAQAANQVLRYVGVIAPGEGSIKVELRAYAADHPFARLKGGDNIVAFKTARYHTQPLIVQGPGAGPEVTAGGVFADLLRLASTLGGANS
jgi:aspartokinase/homoserine dehydrogenase 1